jgi:type VI protein secretion system component Hcp
MRHKFLRSVAAFLFLSGLANVSLAQEQIYVTIDGLRFQVVNETTLPGKFEANSVEFEMNAPLPSKTGTSTSAGRRVVGPLTMTKSFGAGSSLGLIAAMENGDALKSVTIDFVRMDRDKQVLLRTLKLSTVVVSGYKLTGTKDPAGPVETVSLNYVTLEVIVGGGKVSQAIRADR